MKKILITGIRNLASDGILRILHSESNFEVYVLSDKITKPIEKNRIYGIPSNLSDFKNIKKVVYEIKPDIIIYSHNYGNFHSKDKTKIHKENYQIFENFVSISRVLDNHLIYLSNEFVFDGKKGPYSEDDKPGTINYYGSTIHSAENLALTSVNKCTIVRHSLIYGYRMFDYEDFVSDYMFDLQSGNNFNLSFNYYTTPILVEEFSYAILKIIEKNLLGIYHLSGSEFILLDDFLLEIANFYDLNTSLLRISSSENILKFGLINLKAKSNLSVNFSTINSGLTAMKYYSYGDIILDL